jgi:hypothetical protein
VSHDAPFDQNEELRFSNDYIMLEAGVFDGNKKTPTVLVLSGLVFPGIGAFEVVPERSDAQT